MHTMSRLGWSLIYAHTMWIQNSQIFHIGWHKSMLYSHTPSNIQMCANCNNNANTKYDCFDSQAIHI